MTDASLHDRSPRSREIVGKNASTTNSDEDGFHQPKRQDRVGDEAPGSESLYVPLERSAHAHRSAKT